MGQIGVDEFLPPEPPPPVVRAPEAEPDEDRSRPIDPEKRRFWIGVLVIAVVGAAIRLGYVLTDHRIIIGGDGFDYHYSALRLADGLGFVRAFGDVGVPAAHLPPGWTTLLGGVSWLGLRSLRDHQLVGVALGLTLVVLAAMIGRRYFNPRVGLIAAAFAAVYPGFWLLEGNVLAEPLALVLLGVLLLLVADLRDRPTWPRTVLVGVVAGALALTHPEQLVVAAVVVAPILLGSRALSVRQRLARLAVVTVVGAAVLAPWAVYNSTRFEDPVLISTGGGAIFLGANCAPGSYTGPGLGFSDGTCRAKLSAEHPGSDESQLDSLARSQAFQNMRDHSGRLLVVIPARLGRLLAVFRPSQTVGFVAQQLVVDTWLVWAWVASFWVILIAAAVGAVMARRRGRAVWPLVAPFAVSVVLLLVVVRRSAVPRAGGSGARRVGGLRDRPAPGPPFGGSAAGRAATSVGAGGARPDGAREPTAFGARVALTNGRESGQPVGGSSGRGTVAGEVPAGVLVRSSGSSWHRRRSRRCPRRRASRRRRR